MRKWKRTITAVLLLVVSSWFWFAGQSRACNPQTLCRVICHPSGDSEKCDLPDFPFNAQNECSCFTATTGWCHAQCDGGMQSESKFCHFLP